MGSGSPEIATGCLIVAERKRRLDGIDRIVLSLSAREVTTGGIAGHFEEVYGGEVSKETISRITEKVTGELAEWFFSVVGCGLSGDLR